MICPKCNSENVEVTTEQVNAKTRKRSTGCLWKIGRWFLNLFTLGVWRIFGKRKGTEKTAYKNQTVAICQDCGHKWKV